MKRRRTKGRVRWWYAPVWLLWLLPALLWGQNHGPHKQHAFPAESFLVGQLPPSSEVSEATQVAQVFRRRLDVEHQESIPEAQSPERRNTFSPVEDRWRLGYQRNLLNPYTQNVLKGDYPIFGQHVFFALTGISDSLFEFRELPVPAGVSTAQPNSH